MEQGAPLFPVSIVNPVYVELNNFSEGLAVVLVGDQWGYIDQAGALAIAPQFDDARGFADGLAAVVLSGRNAYIDTSGAIIWQDE